MVWITYILFRIILYLRSALESIIDVLLDVQFIPHSLCSQILRMLLFCWTLLNNGLLVLYDRLRNDPRSDEMVWMPRVTFFPPVRA